MTADAPIFEQRFWRNRRGEAVTIAIKKIENADIIDIRIWFTDKDGILKPTTKGVACAIRKLPELAQAINRAVAAARELGLIGGGS